MYTVKNLHTILTQVLHVFTILALAKASILLASYTTVTFFPPQVLNHLALNFLHIHAQVICLTQVNKISHVSPTCETHRCLRSD